MSCELPSPRQSNPGIAVALVIVFMSLSLAIAAAEPWHQLGPSGPGSFRSLAVDPQDPLTMYAASANAGIFKSVDGGESWELLEESQSLRGHRGSLQIHPIATSVLYFEGGGLFKSEDGGAGWVSIDPREVDPLYQNIFLKHLTLDPESPQILFAAGREGVSRSLDAGKTWHRTNSGLPQSASGTLSEVTALAVDPLNPIVVYAGLTEPSEGRRHVLFRSVDRGEGWEEVSVFTYEISQIVVDPSDSAVIYVASRRNQVLHSTLDGGNSWTRHILRHSPSFPQIVLDPNNPSTVLVPVLDYIDGPMLWKSSDRGEHWESFETPWFLRSLVFDASLNVVYAATDDGSHGLYQSWDQGESWIPFGQDVHDKTITHIEVGPEGSSSLYANEFYGGIYRSLNDGESWVPLERFLSSDGDPKNVTALTVDPVTPALYAGVSSVDGWRDDSAVLVSLDEGESWDKLTYYNVRNLYDPTTILVDPWDPSNLYLGTMNPASFYGHLYRSFDGGKSWNLSLEFKEGPMVPVIDPLNPSVLYIGNASHYDNTVGIMKTMDSGDTWVEHGDGLPPGEHGGITAIPVLTIDALNPDNLLAATEQGIYKSTDGAQFWWRVDNDWPDDLVATDLLIDPLVSSTIYAATQDLGVLRSVDGGVSWTQFSEGLATERVLNLELNATRRILYAGTDGGGVFARSLVDDRPESFAIFADPNPIRLCGETARATRIMWHAPGVPKTQVRVGAPDGPLFAAGRQQGAKATGNWVRDGMKFLLLRRDSGEVLAQTTVRLTDSGCEVLSADPNPIPVCEGSVGVTTLSWFVASTFRTEIRVGSLTGELMARGGPVGVAQTGNWVRDGMQFFLVDQLTQEALSQVRISHTQDSCSK